ncbi:protein kinase domain-containing protein [Haematococcus lacustris]|uniref:Protein kinase domain-containing protein n=1 Tax=Haematococcus lacustris TaxID=44745 RepID=A0A699YYS5_HAELA|nr:protein kinase domain-containing protein [Haematococcus lacustris]
MFCERVALDGWLVDWRQHPYLAAYELQHVIGEGGFSEVWLALHKLTKQKVVIKAVYLSKPGLRPEQAVILEAEAKFLRLLDHPHIVRCHSVLESKYDLVVEAVAYMHGLNLLHRDIKPENVMFKRPVAAYQAAGKAPKVKLIDLGMAGVLGTKASGMLHGCMGSPGFMAPEVVRGGGWAGMAMSLTLAPPKGTSKGQASKRHLQRALPKGTANANGTANAALS